MNLLQDVASKCPHININLVKLVIDNHDPTR